jgi:hypothetical protein
LFYDKTNYYGEMIAYTGRSGQSHEIIKVDIHPAFKGITISKYDLAIVTVCKNNYAKELISFQIHQGKSFLNILKNVQHLL